MALYSVSWLLLLKAIWDAGLALQTGFLGWWAVFHRRVPVYPPLPTEGLFRVVRQPIYAAFSLTLWTVPIWTPDQLAVAIVLTIYCLGGPLLKEQRFRQRFGQSFRTYAAQVPYWSPWPRPATMRNDRVIFDGPADWRTDEGRPSRDLVLARFAFFDPIVRDWRGKAVLDLGGGDGEIALALTERGAQVTAADPSPPANRSATRQAGSASKIVFPFARAGGLPYADGIFDIVACIGVLDRVVDRKAILLEIHRVLRPNGLLLFDTVTTTRLASGILPIARPRRLARELKETGFDACRFVSMLPRGLNPRFAGTFRIHPTMPIQYLGQARARLWRSCP
jgi:2-polyprenyl-3-methyl-5-hydroxy-6-metoxy-1,4-benzoquinol methylase